MEKERKIELLFVIVLIAVSLAGGIYCSIVYPNNTVPGAVCFSISITSLVYWFLGGIQVASLQAAGIKLGGSIAALLASFLLLNHEMGKDIPPEASDAVLLGTQYLLDLETEEPAVVSVLVNKRDTFQLNTTAFKQNRYNTKRLYLDSALEVRTATHIALGQLDEANLQEKQWYRTITNSSDPGELLTFNLGKTHNNARLDLSITAQRFRGDGIAEIQFASIKSKTFAKTLFIQSKGMQVLQLGSKFYMISATQANFEKTDPKAHFIQLFIKPFVVQ